MIEESSQSNHANVKILVQKSQLLKQELGNIKEQCVNLNVSSNILQIKKKFSNNSSTSKTNSIKPPCINKICPKYKSFKHHHKSYPFHPQDLCSDCLIQYKKQSYCFYCKQIYFDSSDDGKQWILCEDCGRWVHSECANYDSAYDQFDFKCLICKKTQSNEGFSNNAAVNTNANVRKPGFKLSSNKTSQRRKVQECSLNSFGFYWQLGPSELAEDMDKIRQYLQ